MIELSLCMIVKNERDTLARCLDSAAPLADEIIVVDTGSTDETRAIALKYTENVFDFKWIDDFSSARNFAFSKATRSHILWLDADDVILPADARAISALKASLPPDVDTVMLRYNTAFDEHGEPTFSYFRERIVRNCAHAHWHGAVHEVIVPFGKIIHNNAAVCHKKTSPGDPARNLKIYRAQIARGESLLPRERFYFARELYYNGLFAEAERELERFLDGKAGWIENNIEACRILALCLYAQGREDDALRALMRSMDYAPPRAEICCDIGNHFLGKERFEDAVRWFEAALSCPRNDASGAFVQPECYGFLPCLQLCVCWYRLGDAEKSAEYNRRAGEIKPQSPEYLQNLEFFARQNK